MKVLIYNQNEKVRLVVGQLLKEMSFNVLMADSQENLMEKLKTANLYQIINQIIKQLV